MDLKDLFVVSYIKNGCITIKMTRANNPNEAIMKIVHENLLPPSIIIGSKRLNLTISFDS